MADIDKLASKLDALITILTRKTREESKKDPKEAAKERFEKSIVPQDRELRRQLNLMEKMGKTDQEMLQTSISLQEVRKQGSELLVQMGKMTSEQANEMNNYYDGEIFKLKEKIQLQGQSVNAQEQFSVKVKSAMSVMSGGFIQNNKEAVLMMQNLGGIRGAMSAIGHSISEMLGLGNMLASVVSNMKLSFVEVAFAQEQAFSAMHRATGAGKEYRETIERSFHDTRQFGIDVTEATDSMVALHQGFRDFNLMSRETQESLIETTAILSEIGVSSTTTAEAMNILSGTFFMNASQIETTVTELAKLGPVLGSSEEAMSQFIAVSGRLAVYPASKATEVFREMSFTAKALKTDVQTLFDIVAQYDTFEGAAQSAASLNAILGGNLLNSMDLLLANEHERVMMLRESIALSGKNWAELHKFERMAIASAAGIQDMNEAAKIFGTSAVEFEKGRREAEKLAAQQKELTDRAAEAQNVMDQIKILGYQIVIALEPILTLVKDIVTVIIDWNEAWDGWLIPAILIGIGIIKTLIFLLPILGFGIGIAGTAAGAAAPGFAAAGGGLTTLGIGALLVAAAFGIIMLSLTLFIIGMTKLFTAISDNMEGWFMFIGSIGVLAISLSMLAGAMALLGITGVTGLVGLSMLAIGLGLVGGALLLIKTADLEALSSIFESLSKMSTVNISSATGSIVTFVRELEEMAAARSIIIDALENMRLNNFAIILDRLSESMSNVRAEAGAFASATKPFVEAVETTANLDEGKVALMERFSNATSEIMVTATTAASAGAEKVLEQVKGIVEHLNKKAEADKKETQRPMIFVIDEKVFARQVEGVVEEKKKMVIRPRVLGSI